MILNNDHEPQIKLPGLLAILCICLVIAFLGYISETNRVHAKQIAQITTNCVR